MYKGNIKKGHKVWKSDTKKKGRNFFYKYKIAFIVYYNNIKHC